LTLDVASETLNPKGSTRIGDISWKKRAVDVLPRTVHLYLAPNASRRDETVSADGPHPLLDLFRRRLLLGGGGEDGV
jgi:hypothetical protein